MKELNDLEKKVMTREEAKTVLCANVMVACERAKFDKATCKMIEDALDIAINALEQLQLVYCKDCKYKKPSIIHDYDICTLSNTKIKGENWFCAEGRRKMKDIAIR